MESRVTLGEMYRDKLTGFSGVATVRAEYATGKPRVALERKGDAEEKFFNEERLESAPEGK